MGSILSLLFKHYNVVGMVGNRNVGKSSLVLSSLVELKAEQPNIPICVFGVEENLKEFLVNKGFVWLYSQHDILDMRVRDSVIFVDEVADFFSTQTRDKETKKFKRFINRISHLNNHMLFSTAEVSWWNKFACSLVDCFLVKRVDFDNLVNGTWLKQRVLGLENSSDYRLDIKNNEYFVVSDFMTDKLTFEYVRELDSKRDLSNPFVEKSELKSD